MHTFLVKYAEVCHPEKHPAAVVEKKTALAGMFIRGLGFCDNESVSFVFSDLEKVTLTT